MAFGRPAFANYPSPEQASRGWKEGRFKPVYYLFGEHASGKALFAARLKEVLAPDPFNLDEFSGEASECVEAAVSAALTLPMLSVRRLVVLKTPKLPAEARKRLAAYLAEPLESTTLLLFSEDKKPDPRDVLASAAIALGGLVLCRPMSETEAAARLREDAAKAGSSLDADTAAWIASEAGTDSGVLASELQKMLLFTRGRREITRDDALACLGYRRTSNPYAFTDAVAARDGPGALALLRRLLEEGDEPIHVLSLMTRTLRKQLWALRMARAGMAEFEVKNALKAYERDFFRATGRLREPDLRADLRECLELDARLKSQAWLDRGAEVERLCSDVCSG